MLLLFSPLFSPIPYTFLTLAGRVFANPLCQEEELSSP